MSIIFWIYEPLRLSRAVDLWTASAVSSSLYGPRRLHAHMSTQMRYAQYALGIALLFVLGRLALRSQWLESNCDSQFVNALTNLFGKTNVPRLVIIEPQWLRTQRNSVEARGPQLSAAKLWPSRKVAFLFYIYFDRPHFYWQFVNIDYFLHLYQMTISFWCKFCKS